VHQTRYDADPGQRHRNARWRRRPITTRPGSAGGRDPGVNGTPQKPRSPTGSLRCPRRYSLPRQEGVVSAMGIDLGQIDRSYRSPRRTSPGSSHHGPAVVTGRGGALLTVHDPVCAWQRATDAPVGRNDGVTNERVAESGVGPRVAPGATSLDKQSRAARNVEGEWAWSVWDRHSIVWRTEMRRGLSGGLRGTRHGPFVAGSSRCAISSTRSRGGPRLMGQWRLEGSLPDDRASRAPGTGPNGRMAGV